MENHKKFSRHDINHNIHDHLNEISREFRAGFEELKKYPKSITIFGSSRSTPASSHYRDAQELAYRVTKELGYTVITGGGPGIMAAANLGAKEAGGKSIGLTIRLPDEQHTNPYVTDSLNFKYFFARKTMLTFAAEAFVFFPGGYGTLDEFFSIVTLVQTRMIPRVPIILVGKDYWNAFKTFLTAHALETHHAISQDDIDLFHITNSIEATIDIIKKAPVSKWWETVD